MNSVAGYSAHPPVHPKFDTVTSAHPGAAASSSAVSNPIRRASSGLAASSTASALRAIADTAPRSATTLRFPPLRNAKNAGCRLRKPSPDPDSTLTTSAPASRSNFPAYDAARRSPISTTLRPESGWGEGIGAQEIPKSMTPRISLPSSRSW